MACALYKSERPASLLSSEDIKQKQNERTSLLRDHYKHVIFIDNYSVVMTVLTTTDETDRLYMAPFCALEQTHG